MELLAKLVDISHHESFYIKKISVSTGWPYADSIFPILQLGFAGNGMIIFYDGRDSIAKLHFNQTAGIPDDVNYIYWQLEFRPGG